jgi:hypothetical protein
MLLVAATLTESVSKEAIMAKRRKSVRRRSARKVSRRRLHGLGYSPKQHENSASLEEQTAASFFDSSLKLSNSGQCASAVEHLALGAEHLGKFVAHKESSQDKKNLSEILSSPYEQKQRSLKSKFHAATSEANKCFYR